MINAIDAGRGELSEVQARSAQAVPMRRYGTAAEVAAMIAFISSDDASFTTGSTLCLDGGLVAGRG
jgi:meso-butanediol dehydrogenase/(S,S)-butanediol dehydrogenase/diacetyl reductase